MMILLSYDFLYPCLTLSRYSNKLSQSPLIIAATLYVLKPKNHSPNLVTHNTLPDPDPSRFSRFIHQITLCMHKTSSDIWHISNSNGCISLLPSYERVIIYMNSSCYSRQVLPFERGLSWCGFKQDTNAREHFQSILTPNSNVGYGRNRIHTIYR
jgi:hypothetical protein